MKTVAEFKCKFNIPIEDISQEKKIIFHSKYKANILGLNENSIECFIIALITVAKLMQYRYTLDLRDNNDATFIIFNNYYLDNIRLEIKNITDMIIELIAKELNNKHCITNIIAFYINNINCSYFNCLDKKIISDALQKISFN